MDSSWELILQFDLFCVWDRNWTWGIVFRIDPGTWKRKRKNASRRKSRCRSGRKASNWWPTRCGTWCPATPSPTSARVCRPKMTSSPSSCCSTTRSPSARCTCTPTAAIPSRRPTCCANSSRWWPARPNLNRPNLWVQPFLTFVCDDAVPPNGGPIFFFFLPRTISPTVSVAKKRVQMGSPSRNEIGNNHDSKLSFMVRFLWILISKTGFKFVEVRFFSLIRSGRGNCVYLNHKKIQNNWRGECSIVAVWYCHYRLLVCMAISESIWSRKKCKAFFSIKKSIIGIHFARVSLQKQKDPSSRYCRFKFVLCAWRFWQHYFSSIKFQPLPEKKCTRIIYKEKPILIFSKGDVIKKTRK